MARIIDNRTTLEKTIKIFDSFYATNLKVAPDKYDVVRGYFLGICPTKSIADNFTAVLFRIADQTGINVLDLLAELKGSGNKLEMNKKMAYYLNGIKSKTALYGVSVVPRPVIPVARNIVQ